VVSASRVQLKRLVTFPDQTVTIRMGDVDIAPARLSRDTYGIAALGRF
jgi:hypothetical protein